MKSSRKPGAGRRFLLILLPFVLFACGVFLCSIYLFGTVLQESSYVSLIIGSSAPSVSSDQDTGFVPGSKPDRLSRIPSISYGSQFARLNVTWETSGWEIQNIPVYLGTDKNILKKGAGMSYASYFPGEGGCTILSAHVTKHFAELESTPIGAIVLLETSYGPYQYQVVDRIAVDGTDRWYMDPSNAYDLLMYSCYPRDNNG